MTQSMPTTRSVSLVAIATVFVLTVFVLTKNQSSREQVVDDAGPKKLAKMSLPCRGSASVQEFMQKSEEIWQKSVNKRHELVGSRLLKDIDPWTYTGAPLWWWDYFYPAYDCPSHMERIGRVGDGGKWVCGFSVFEASSLPCIVYSFGVAEESTFEAEIIERSQSSQIWAYDPTVDGMVNSLEAHERVHFKKFGIGENDGGRMYTLGSLMKQNGHNWIDILKMNVETAEFGVLGQILSEFDLLPFGQLQVEFHVEGQKFEDFYKLWEGLEAKGLRAIQMEPNDCASGSKPIYMEYAFINVKGEHNRLIH